MTRSCAAIARSVAIALLLLTFGGTFGGTFGSAFGQTFDTEYYPVGGWGDNPAGDGTGDNAGQGYDPQNWQEVFAPQSDAMVFSTPTWGAADPFRDFSRYRFGTVRYRERGLDGRHFRAFLGGVDLADNLNSYPDWALITLARRSGLATAQIPAMVPGAQSAGIARAEGYSLGGAGDALYVQLRTGDRYSRAGGDIRHSHEGAKGWSYALAATGQWGDDGHFAGVYSDEAGGSASLSKAWKSGARVTLFAAGGVSERGVRTAATKEAFELTGNNFYNPVWGLQGGNEGGLQGGGNTQGGNNAQSKKPRNSRTTGTDYFFAAAELLTPIGTDRTLSVTIATRDNRNGRSRLAWYDAHSPLPDYYRSMPSFFPEWDAAETIAEGWRTQDPTVTQLDWDALYYNNTLAADGRATYIVEEQVEHARDLHANISVERHIDGGLMISYGAKVRRDDSRLFKVADDMLGAEWVPNVDQYITDDDGEPHTAPPDENDLRNPGRQVRRGERFGYDYSITRLRPEAFGTVQWYGPRHGLTASASFTHTRLQREGFYEKALFPGAASFGRSEALAFNTYSLAVAAYLDAGTRHRFSLSALASTEAPAARNLFISPQQNNIVAAGATPSGLYGAEASWVFTGDGVDLRVGGFVNSVTGETQIRQYYDDLASRFADMVVRGIDRLGYGIEAGLTARFTQWLSLSAGGSVGSYRYNSEPTATLHEDATGEVFANDILCYMSGLSTGLPSRVAGVELMYYDRSYLRFSIQAEWLGGRAVEVNPLFHSSRVTGINSAPEVMEMFTGQEQLPDAFTLGLSLSKGWVVGSGYLRVAAGVRNLLSADIIHSGYEQMRIRRLGSGLDRVLVPFPPKYMYAYPMTWSATISYRL
ncbi:MAG: hypothetical protein LBV38_04205 [Alistipes sp.]|jgi:hypothetical protein|nr:hypothetical protein [Alistipes sp.]